MLLDWLNFSSLIDGRHIIISLAMIMVIVQLQRQLWLLQRWKYCFSDTDVSILLSFVNQPGKEGSFLGIHLRFGLVLTRHRGQPWSLMGRSRSWQVASCPIPPVRCWRREKRPPSAAGVVPLQQQQQIADCHIHHSGCSPDLFHASLSLYKINFQILSYQIVSICFIL